VSRDDHDIISAARDPVVAVCVPPAGGREEKREMEKRVSGSERE